MDVKAGRIELNAEQLEIVQDWCTQIYTCTSLLSSIPSNKKETEKWLIIPSIVAMWLVQWACWSLACGCLGKGSFEDLLDCCSSESSIINQSQFHHSNCWKSILKQQHHKACNKFWKSTGYDVSREQFKEESVFFLTFRMLLEQTNNMKMTRESILDHHPT